MCIIETTVPSDEKLPQPDKGDYAHVALKAALSAVPIVGSPAAEIFAAVLAPPLVRRRDRWLESLADGLRRLQEQVDGFRIEALSDNEPWVSAAMQATQIALRNHQDEKLEALRNAVLNMAVGRSPAEEEQLIFLGYIDAMSTWHIRVLRFFERPLEFARERGLRTDGMMGSPSDVLEDFFPDLRGRRDFYDQIVKDLHARGLLTLDQIHTTMSASGMFAKRTAGMADRFLQLIAPT